MIWFKFQFVPYDPVHNTSASVQVMARRRIGDTPLPEPMTAMFCHACLWRHYALRTLCYNKLTLKELSTHFMPRGIIMYSKQIYYGLRSKTKMPVKFELIYIYIIIYVRYMISYTCGRPHLLCRTFEQIKTHYIHFHAILKSMRNMRIDFDCFSLIFPGTLHWRHN